VKENYGVYTWKDLEKAVVYVKQTWLLSKSTTQYSRFDAISNKYSRQNQIDVKNMWPPSVTQSVIENWIYPKKLNEAPKNTSEPMEIDQN